MFVNKSVFLMCYYLIEIPNSQTENNVEKKLNYILS